MTGSRTKVCTISVALASLVLTTGVGSLTASASAASDPLSYDCDFGVAGLHVATAVVDTDAPATLTYGQTVPITASSVVTLPEELVDILITEDVASVDGTATAIGTVDGVERQAVLTIPRTDVPASNPMEITGHGPAGNLTPGPSSPTIELGARRFGVSLNAYDSADEPMGDPIAISCELQSGQDTHVDTVTVLPASTTTSVSVQSSPIAYGASPSLTAEVTQTGSIVKPGGTVAFSLDGTTVSAPVQGGKAKVDLPPAFEIGVRAVTATFTPDVKNLASSQASTFLTVVRDSTKTVARAVYRDQRQRLVGRARVVATHEAAVAGAVRLVLKRDGVRIRVAKVGLNQFGKAKKAFENVTKPGRYTVVTRYLGSPTFKRSADRARVTL